MEETLLAIKNMYLEIFGGGAYIVLFLISLLYVLLSKKEKDNHIKIFFWHSAILAIIILNPIVYKVLENILTGNVYWRMFWMLPIGIIIPYVATKIVSDYSLEISKNIYVEKIIISIAIIIIIVLSGKLVFNKENFQVATNWYKLPQDAMDVAWIISNDEAEYKNVLVPETIVAYIRQYDSDIYLRYPRNPHTYQYEPMVLALQLGNVDEIIKDCKIYGTNYVVFRNETELIGSMEENGFEILEKTGAYTIYKWKGNK